MASQHSMPERFVTECQYSFELLILHQPKTAGKYKEEYLDAYIRDERIYDLSWEFRGFVVKDCDGRLLCFGQSTEY